jgi:hypothetical protein
MNGLQKIVNRLEFLLDKEKVSEAELRNLQREFQDAGMAEELRTNSTMAFCMDLYATLSELTPLAIATPSQHLIMYQTAQDLVDAIIPSNHHLD